MQVPERPRLALRRNLHLVDMALILLAFASVVVFLLHRTGALGGDETRVLLGIDLAVVAAYGLLFVAKWAAADDPAVWLRRHAFLLLGLLPLTVAYLPEPWFLVAQIVVLVLRAGKALDKWFGQPVLAGISERYTTMVVEELTEPLLMRLAVVLEDAVTSRDYAAAIGKRIDQRRDLLEAAVARAIAASPKLTFVAQFGPVRRLVDESAKEVVDAAHAALTGPEVNALVREAFKDVFAELKDGIRERKWERRGVGLSDVALGMVAREARAERATP